MEAYAFTRQADPAGLTMGRRQPEAGSKCFLSLLGQSLKHIPPRWGGPDRAGRGRRRTYLVNDMVRKTKEREQHLAVAGKHAVCRRAHLTVVSHSPG